MYRYFKLAAGLVSAFFVGLLSFSPPHEAYASIAGAVRFIAVFVALVTAALTIWDFLKSRPDKRIGAHSFSRGQSFYE